MSTTKGSAPKSKIVVLSLSPELLAKATHVPYSQPSEASKPSASPDTPAQVIEPTPADTPNAASPIIPNGTDDGMLAPPAAATGPKRKGVPGPKAGTKRGAAAIDGVPKPRGKPGPKSKKQKLGDMINDPNHKGPFAASAPIPKLGPKANVGAINANLRALDRTGKPCRKWAKKGFSIRSFTGVAWDVPTWRAPKKAAVFAEDVKSDSTGSSDSKVKDESSAISDKSGALADAATPQPPALASSPAPATAAAS
ncbi:hypothetical protein CC80DRAFT_474870 [Byssothecium circinans]|uniref:DUF1711-domain-containing protein n=1 Tax=Byssothecium circinans TaxID=147558 RepID=A0A6A5TXH4_9PLEO|nr:hypothetical protein CC80DRAFT_474870 [Byssothecium circinans]